MARRGAFGQSGGAMPSDSTPSSQPAAPTAGPEAVLVPLLLDALPLPPGLGGVLEQLRVFLTGLRWLADTLPPAKVAPLLEGWERALAAPATSPDALPDPLVPLASLLAARGRNRAPLLHLVQAMRREVTNPRCPGWSDLMLQARFAAMPAGRLLLAFAGEPDQRAGAAMDALAGALFVLGRIDAAGEAARRLGRCYLPEAWLREAGGGATSLAAPEADAALRATVARLLERVRAMLDQAAALPALARTPGLGRHCATSIALARRLARRMAAADPLVGPVRLTAWDRRLALWLGWWRARFPGRGAAAA